MTNTLLAIKSDIKLDSDESDELLKVRFDSALQFTDPDALKEVGNSLVKNDSSVTEEVLDLDKIRKDAEDKIAKRWQKGNK